MCPCELLRIVNTKLQEALEVHRQHYKTVRIVLLDLQMPVMDGWTAVAAMRKFLEERAGVEKDPVLVATLRQLPICALTANAFSHQRQETLDAGFTTHLSKPVNRKALQRLLISAQIVK